MPFCELCPSVMLARDGTESRMFRDEYGGDHVIPLQRYYCPRCLERYIERPDCLEKGKLYLKWIIDRVRSGDKKFEMFIQCDPSTIYRWKKG